MGYPLSSVLIFLSALFITQAQATTPVSILVFINSIQPEHNKLVREIQHQLYFSQQLQRRLSVTIIDINTQGENLSGPAGYIKDRQGIWAEKYRPAETPSLFCLKGKKAVYIKMASAREIRSCL